MLRKRKRKMAEGDEKLVKKKKKKKGRKQRELIKEQAENVEADFRAPLTERLNLIQAPNPNPILSKNQIVSERVTIDVMEKGFTKSIGGTALPISSVGSVPSSKKNKDRKRNSRTAKLMIPDLVGSAKTACPEDVASPEKIACAVFPALCSERTTSPE